MRILIVEDEVVPAHYLERVLSLKRYEVVDIVSTGTEAINAAHSKKPDVILMDMMLKDHISGAEAAKQIHYADPEIIIIFLTAYSDKEMIDFAIEAEAFAYLLKPYRDREILATLALAEAKLAERASAVQAFHQEACKESKDEVLLKDGYVYNMKLQRLFLEGKEVHLGSKALKLIALLCENKHITLKIDTILQALWDEPKSGQTLRSLIHRIRTATSPHLIENTNKFGYRIGLKE